MNRKKVGALALAILMCMGLLAGCGRNTDGTISVTAKSLAEFDYGNGLDETGYFSGVKATDYVTLPQYKDLTIDAALTTANPDSVAAEIDMLLNEYPTYEAVDKAVEDGDTVNIDYVGKVDGVPFEGGDTQGMGTEVTIGVTSYIDDFLEQLIGHKAGETFDIEVTFPDSYPQSPELEGKDAIFTVTINSVYGDPVYPTELTEEMAFNSGFETVEELRAYIENWVLMSQKVEYVQKLLVGVETKRPLPQSVLNYAASLALMTYQYYADMMSTDIDSIIANYSGGTYASLAAYLEANDASIRETAAYYLAMQAIAETEGLTVSEDDLKASGYDVYMEQYNAGYVRLVAMQDYVIPNFIFDHAAASTEG